MAYTHWTDIIIIIIIKKKYRIISIQMMLSQDNLAISLWVYFINNNLIYISNLHKKKL